MSTTVELKGIVPAILTPIDDSEAFAPAAFEALLDSLYAAGVHGVYVCGQTGEGLQQTVEQRKRVAEASVKGSPRGKQVIVHVGAARTADAVELARHASRIGATAVSALPPQGLFPFEEIRAYYRDVAAASGVPFLVYYFPETCPAIRSLEQILELCEIPGVVGLKFTDYDLYRMRMLKHSGAVIFNGRDEVLTAGLLMGADGGIGTYYNVVPEMFVDIYQRAQRGDWLGARDVQDRINHFMRIALRYPQFPAVKQILKWRGIDCGGCIRPRQGLTLEQTRRLREELESTGIRLT